MELEIEWKGWYGLNIETPPGMEGLRGLFANLYDSEIYYIGKAQGKSHLFQESKHRYKSLKKALTELGVLKEPIDRTAMDKIAKEHCKKYVGILQDESKLAFLDSAENLLIFTKKPKGNDKLKKRYKGTRPFKLINRGEKSILAALGLEDYYEIL